MPLTPDEHERLAYIQGDTRTAELYAHIQALQSEPGDYDRGYEDGSKDGYDEGYEDGLAESESA